MRTRFLLSLLLALFLVPSSHFGQTPKKPLLCGTSPATTQRELYLHQRATERRARLLQAGIRQLGEGGRLLDLARTSATVSGDILVMRGDGGVILGRNLFPGSLVGRTIQYEPSDAAATAYRVRLADPPYREDATQGSAINLRQPATGSPLLDDDSREFDLPFPFPLYGRIHTRLFVNSNGHITFGAPDSFAETSDFSGFLEGPPKIAGASMDLDPEASSVGGVFVFLQPTEVIVSYQNIFEYGTSNRLDFQIRITPDGSIGILHRRGPFGDFTVGITPGSRQGVVRLITYTNPPPEPIAESIAEIFSGGADVALDVFRATQVFLQNQPDQYDYVVFYNDANVPTGLGAVAFALNVRNQVEGTGDQKYDRGLLFGSSSAGRLQTVINMGPLSQYPDDPNGRVDALGFTESTPLSVLAHEAGHRFLAFPRLREGPFNTTSLLGRQLAHWNFRFNSHGSFLEGSDLSAPPTGAQGITYTTGPPTQRFSELDLYLMGLIPAQEVGQQQSLFYVDGLGTTRPPQAGVQISGPRRDFSMADIIAANGARVPDHRIAQRRFRFAFVLVTQDETKVQPALEKLDRYRREFVEYFNSRSGGLAVADTVLRPGLSMSASPAAAVLAGATGQLQVTRRDTGAELPLRLEGAGAFLTLATTAAIGAGSNSVTLPFTALQPGVARVRVEAASGNYLPAEAAVVVTRLEEATLSTPSPIRVQAAPNAEAISPIRVRVLDPQGLPVQGVVVRFEALTGGFAQPETAVSNASGDVSFRWTVGAGNTNEAAIYIDGQRARTERKVTALANLLPEVRAATNGASFAAGVSPGSLASLFGVSLAGGATRSATLTPLPTELAGVSVSINGAAAPLVFVSDLQINFYVPASTSGSTARVVVTTPDGASSAFDTPLAAIQPGVFFDAGSNLGAVLRNNFGSKTNVVPAVPGDFVQIFATGLGPLVPPPGRGLLVTQFPVRVRLGGQLLPENDVPDAGAAPGFVGLYQVNARIPANLPPGTYPLRLIVEGIESNEVNVIVGAAP